VAFSIDGLISNEHENAFARANGVKKNRILEMIRESEPRKLAEIVLGYDFVKKAPLEAGNKIKEKVVSVKNELEVNQRNITESKNDQDRAELEEQILNQQRQIEELNNKLSSMPIRWLEVYEHRPILEKSLLETQERLLIISPWIKASAANKKLLHNLEMLLKRGIRVYIGYGLGEDNTDEKSQNDKKAEQDIEHLSQNYSNLCLRRLGDTHAKILISDSKFAVVTSFNWLSFRGDPNRQFRDERGTLISDEKKVNELFEDYYKRFL